MSLTEHDSPRGKPIAEPQLRVELVRTPFLTPGLLFFFGLLAVLAAEPILVVAQEVAKGQPLVGVVPQLIWVALGGAFVLAIMLRRGLVRRHAVPAVQFFGEYLTLPPHVEAVASRKVSYADVLSVGVHGRPGRLELLLETRNYVFAYNFGSFRDADGAHRVIEELNRRITALPGALGILQQADRRRALAEQALSVRPIATQALLGVVMVIYANLLLLGELYEPLGLVGWGANSSTLVREGEYFRLLVANFLHGDVYGTHLHLVVNTLALYFLGYLVERLLGWARFLIVFLGSAVAATAVSQLLMPGEVSVGASGALFGLLGSLALVNWRFRTELPLGFRQPLRWWVVILILSAAIPLLPMLGSVAPVPFPRIDVAGHAAGFIVGALLTASLVHATLSRDLVRPARPMESAAAMGLVAVSLLGIGQGVLYARDFDSAAKLRVAELMLMDPASGPETVNRAAWAAAINPDASKQLLAVAAPLMQEAVDALPQATELRDTLATVHYRLGNLERAIEEERRALSELPAQEYYATQLARFLAARRADGSPLILGKADTGGLELRLDPAPPADSRALEIDLPDSLRSGLVLLVLITHRDRRLGLLQVELEPGDARTRRVALSERQLQVVAGSGVRLQLALVDAGSPEPVKAPRAMLWKHDASVDAWP